MLRHLYIKIMRHSHDFREGYIMSFQEGTFSGMSQTRLRAWSIALIWTLAGVGFFLTFFSGGGVEEFDTDSVRHLAGAAAIGFGFIGQWTTLWLTRRRGGAVVADERDLQVVARASQMTLVIVLIAIYGLTVGLWTIYEKDGVVPVGWMWFVAYAAVILSVVTNSLAVLVFDRRMGGHG